MKCFIILAIFLAISVHTIVSQNENTNDDSEVETLDNVTNANATNQDDESNDDQAESPEQSVPVDDEDIENNSNGTIDDNTTTTMTNAEKVQDVISGLPQKCQARYTTCYGPASTESDIQNKVIAETDDDDVCELIEDGEDCVTTQEQSNVCTEDEYEEVRVQACSACRSAVLSVVLVGFLSLISKVLSHH